MAKTNWIKDAIKNKNKGSLRETLGTPKDQNISKKKLDAAAKQKGKTGQRARLAQTLGGFKKKGKA